MTQAERKAAWDRLIELGWVPNKHYRDYNQADLELRLQQMSAAGITPESVERPDGAPDPSEIRFQADVDHLRETPPDTVPGLRLNTHGDEKPLRIDDDGKVWYRDEITKASYPKERGKRVIEYIDPGVRTQVIRDSNGSIVESFEMPGDQHRVSQAKISLPAYQVGLYRDPALLGEFFRIHVYQERRGFDLFDVEKYFGGKHQIPSVCKRIYVDTVLCYDIDSVIQAIQDEYRENLKNKQGAIA
ncbi:hypothetical protein HWD16_gp43 [Microbacterium phage Arete]|uniref:Uncharacterized protein n=1 Tax=Microbacterium phage Arete TaxID=2713257 RepID=A0A6G8R172_9CAUD|nr:hypothetical protein HWD16_gp43 [Microbacterium phage Arete]QIN93926.1 hypothetical protein SEA_ARETE_43 [Microbacterium phage Arete]